jgi:hypothetical protein
MARYRSVRRHVLVVATGVVLALLVAVAVHFFGTPPASSHAPEAASSVPVQGVGDAPKQVPASGAPGDGPRLLFGIGDQAPGAVDTRLVRQAQARMLTSWYTGPKNLTWITDYRNSVVPSAYAQGYALHLVVYSDDAEVPVQTKYGMACGRPYPLSDRFADDMRILAQTFGGPSGGPPLYVTLFTEFQTYPCADSAWNPDPATNAYYRALKDQYLAAVKVFHDTAANAKVSLGWGGWQVRFDNPATGGGRSMFGYFADVMHASDFQSFQAMQNDGNTRDVRTMVRTLGGYGPVMLAHYKPDNAQQATFDKDVHAMLTDAYLREMVAAGLFAWSFMDEKNLAASPATYDFVVGAVARYGRPAH